MPASSARRASLRQSVQVASQRSGTRVAVRADEQFAPNRPIFNAFAVYIVTRPRIEPFWAAMAASCIAILGLLLDLSDPALTLRPLSTLARGSKNRQTRRGPGRDVMRRWWLAVAMLVCCTGAATAEDYPARPVRVVIGFGPGATADITLRTLTPKLGQSLGQQFIVENRTGAGSNLAADFVAHAPKDGYTLLFGTIANTINAAMGQKLNFDFAADFAPTTLTATVPNILVVHPSIGVKSVADLITLARAKPDGLSYGSSGAGTSLHLSAELFNVMTGTRMVHVPYPGSAQAVTDLLAGRVQVMFS